MIVTRLVDVVDHRAQRRRLAGAGGAGDQHEPFLQLAQVQDGRRQSELFRRQDLRRDHAEDRPGSLAIDEGVRAEPREILDFVREVRVVPLAEFLAVRFRHDRREEPAEVLRSEHGRCGIERLDAPVLADERRGADAQVEVGRACRHHPVKQLIDCVRLAHGSGTSLTSTMCAALTISM